MSWQDAMPQCLGYTRTGTRCRKRAMSGSEYCRWHQPATEGAHEVMPAEALSIDEAVALFSEKLVRMSEAIDALDDVDKALQLFAKFAQMVSYYGRLLRDQQALQGGEGLTDPLLALLDKATDEINAELGIEL